MNKEFRRMSLTLTPKLDKQIRIDAVKAGLNLSEMIEEYRNAYLEKLEREKAEIKAKKEATK